MISDTPVLMFDGSVKTAGELNPGDLLMGDDSTPRTVLSVEHGDMETYDVVPVKGETIRVCAGQVLSFKLTQCNKVNTRVGRTGRTTFAATWVDPVDLRKKQTTHATRAEAEEALDKISNKGAIVDMTVEKYASLPKSAKHILKHYRVGVEFPRQEEFDAWIVGIWIGDGDSKGPLITSQDATVLHKIVHMLPKYDLYLRWAGTYAYHITYGRNHQGKNVFLNELRKHNLLKNKHIPPAYLRNDRRTRMEILAGLIDSDGHLTYGGYEITQKKKVISDDIVYLCRSLGFAAYVMECTKSCMYKGEKRAGQYFRVTISGDGLDQVPVVVPRKKASPRNQVKDVLVTGCTVAKAGVAPCTRVVVDRNHRFLLGNFSVIHDVSEVKLQ
jgi:Homing endonuclease